MAAKNNNYKAALQPLLLSALQEGKNMPLEAYLVENSNLPGARINLAMVGAFAAEVGRLVVEPAPLVEQLEVLLDGWAALSLEVAPINQPHEILPVAAVLAYGQVATVRPDWWHDEIGKLYQAATNPRWRVREMVAMAWQLILQKDWAHAYATLLTSLKDDNPLVIRAVVAAIATPPLLKEAGRAENALYIQDQALKWLEKVPLEKRHAEDVRVLRQALAYTVSIAVAATSTAGLELMAKLAKSPDADVQWVVRENWKKLR